ncbi:hypothetical protein D3C72_2587140 [compost metagenome]
MPTGVRMISDIGSGIEWLTPTASISNGPTLMRSPCLKIVTGISLRLLSKSRLASSMPAVNGEA